MKHLARRRFGQNFLTDASVIDRIVDSIQPLPGQLFIEIGPGLGALTRPLLSAGVELHALEIDRDLSGRLSSALGHPDMLTVHQCDALETDLAAVSGSRDYRLVGNLPYNISTPLLFHILEQSRLPEDLHVMLQKEVVERIVAVPGSRDYGRLSVMLQNRCRCAPLFEILPQSFEPQPRVTSALLRLVPRPSPLAAADPKQLDRVVRAAFSMRRKTLRNSLGRLLDAEQISAAGVDPGLRAEQLSIAQFDALARQCAPA